jgi:hypothetical protein
MAWEAHGGTRRAALLEICEDPECRFCRLGERLVETLNDVDLDTTTEILSLVRLLAVTAVATTSRPVDLAELVAAIIGQLHDDVALLTGAKETH